MPYRPVNTYNRNRSRIYLSSPDEEQRANAQVARNNMRVARRVESQIGNSGYFASQTRRTNRRQSGYNR